MRIMVKLMQALTVATFVTTPFVMAQETGNFDSSGSPSNGHALVALYQKQQAAIDLFHAPIKSDRDLAQFQMQHQADSPLRALSPLNQALFLNSLKYNEKGITTIRYDVLESLTPTQAYQILSLFGMQSLTPSLKLKSVSPLDEQIMSITPSLLPLKDYYCEGKGTCRQGANQACSDGC
ncbi:MAG TPA: hypothetical protein VL997_00100 [Dyella sp.]|nr:hypothetical protein [Dyella sp.]